MSNSPTDVWTAALADLQLQIAKPTFDSWLRGTRGVALADHEIVVAVANDYAKDWLEQRLRPTVDRAVAKVTGRPVTCRFVIHRSLRSNAPAMTSAGADGQLPLPEGGPGRAPLLNSQYTFDTFVVGSGSRMAHAASLAVAENAAVKYNPLFIYGGSGLGKTHLLHAVGHSALARGAKVLSVSSETFANDLIAAIRNQSTEAFRDVYRQANVLLVDDIHFIAGKESTQEEFFHTFNALHDSHGQIVMTSDRPPASIATLEERLRSRFQWGLIVDIEPPDLETRIAILSAKAESRGVRLPDQVIEVIANAVKLNVRQLEGALNRILAYSSCEGVEVTIDTAKRAMDELSVRTEPPSPSKVLEAVAEFFGVTPADICGRSRLSRVAEPRQVAMYLMRVDSAASYPQIGSVIGGRDHSTALHGYEKIARLLERDPKLRREIMQLRERLYAA